MTLYNVLAKVPFCDIVTVVDYISGEIYIDRKSVNQMVEEDEELLGSYSGTGLMNFQVRKIRVGKVYSDLIVEVLKY